MPLTLAHPATTGGITAALVSTLLSQDFSVPQVPPLPFEDRDTFWHYPSVLLGILIGIFLAQLLDLLVLARQALQLHLRSRGWGSINLGAIRQRLA